MLGVRLQVANRLAKREWWWSYFSDSRKALGILRKTRARCSCWMCRNLRQNEGLSFQERRQIDGSSNRRSSYAVRSII
jgi:hypothetical protein